MSSVAHDASLFVPPAEVEEVAALPSETFVRQVHLEPGRQIIAIQYANHRRSG